MLNCNHNSFPSISLKRALSQLFLVSHHLSTPPTHPHTLELWSMLTGKVLSKGWQGHEDERGATSGEFNHCFGQRSFHCGTWFILLLIVSVLLYISSLEFKFQLLLLLWHFIWHDVSHDTSCNNLCPGSLVINKWRPQCTWQLIRVCVSDDVTSTQKVMYWPPDPFWYNTRKKVVCISINFRHEGWRTGP